MHIANLTPSLVPILQTPHSFFFCNNNTIVIRYSSCCRLRTLCAASSCWLLMPQPQAQLLASRLSTSKWRFAPRRTREPATTRVCSSRQLRGNIEQTDMVRQVPTSTRLLASATIRARANSPTPSCSTRNAGARTRSLLSRSA